VLIRYSGDVSTKASATKSRFTKRLAQNLADALTANGVRYRIHRGWDRAFVRVDSPVALDVIPRVFGIQSLSRVKEIPAADLNAIVEAGAAFFAGHVRGKRFAVRARRAGDARTLPFRSLDIERDLGSRLLGHSAGVDLNHPDVVAHVEVHADRAYLFVDKLTGRAGLPIGVGGRALSLVSGGFDSAVASWHMLKRGIACNYFFCNLGGAAHRDGVLRVTKVLADHWSYGTHPRLYEVDFRGVVDAIRETITPRYWQVVLKRLMLRTASRVGLRTRASALITGDAIGQVSSQTLQNIAVISRASDLLVLRPLVTSNKEQIISLSREIGTFDLSAGVDEYCAILPNNPATAAPLQVIEEEEAKLDLDAIDALTENPARYDLRALETADLDRPELEVETIEPGCTVIDLRSRPAYDAWHWPEALHLDFTEALRACRAFAKDRRYVLYCEVGLKSAHVAELMREAGFEAWHVKRGVRTLLARSADRDFLGV
jgi:thiamine biosynthesis protein ThiI